VRFGLVYLFQFWAGFLLLILWVMQFGIPKPLAPLLNVIIHIPITYLLNRWDPRRQGRKSQSLTLDPSLPDSASDPKPSGRRPRPNSTSAKGLAIMGAKQAKDRSVLAFALAVC